MSKSSDDEKKLIKQTRRGKGKAVGIRLCKVRRGTEVSFASCPHSVAQVALAPAFVVKLSQHDLGDSATDQEQKFS